MKGYCKYCKCQFAAKLSDLERHRLTSKHKKAQEPFSDQRQGVIPFKKISSESRSVEGALSLFIGCHCSVRVIDHLTDLCKTYFADSKSCADIKLHRSKCTAIIRNVIAPHFMKDLISDIGDKNFSLIIDESNDVSVTKLLSVVIRYYSEAKKEFVVTFLAMIELKECNADAICNALKKCLKDNGLDLQKLLAIGTDNASVMTGINNGVYAKLKKDIPRLILIRCVCHSLQLAVSHAAAECLPRNIEFLVRETYNWFSHSAIRQAKYRELYACINDGLIPLKLVQVSQTRWMSIEGAISRIMQQWIELKAHFEVTKFSEKCYTTDMLHSVYSDQRNYLYLLFLKSVLGEVQRVNKAFEGEVNDPTKLLNDLLNLITSLCSKILIPGRKITDDLVIENHLDPNPYLGYEFQTEMSKSKLTEEEKINLRSRCIKFVVELIKQLRQRLPDNVSVLSKMSAISVSECLYPMKQDIIDLAKLFNEEPAAITNIDFQWRRLHHIKWSDTNDTLRFWSEVSSYRDSSGENPLGELANLAVSLLSLPHSNADVERTFSQMNIIKSKIRNRMNLKTLNSILSTRYGLKRKGKCCYDYKLPKEVVDAIGDSAKYKTQDEPGTSQSSEASLINLEVEDDLDIPELLLLDF